MRRKASVLVLTTLVTALVTAFTLAPSASAQVPIPGATCTQGTTPVACTLELVRFTTQNGALAAVFRLTNDVTGAVTQITVPITTQQPGTTCTILDLTIQPIDLDLLGLHLHTDTIHVVLTGQRGTLLGNLLCGLFFGPGPLQPVVSLLNNALRQGLVTTA